MATVSQSPLISEVAQRALHSVGQRWTPTLVKGVPGISGFVPVVRSFLRLYHKLQLTPAQALFIVHLLDFKRDDAAPYPSYARVARYMGVQPKAVQRYAKALEDKGLLCRLKRRGQANRFDLRPLFVRLEALLVEAKY